MVFFKYFKLLKELLSDLILWGNKTITDEEIKDVARFINLNKIVKIASVFRSRKYAPAIIE